MVSLLAEAARWTGLDDGVVVVLAAIALLLAGGTLIRGVLLAHRRDDPTLRQRWRSVGTWWTLYALLVAALVMGAVAVTAVMVVTAGLLLRESLELAGRRWSSRLLATGLSVSGPAHVAALGWTPPAAGVEAAGVAAGSASAMGGVLLLALLTGLNDSAQAWWGRALGRHALAPDISPGKTWEGLVGGLATTALASVAVAPLLTGWGDTLPLDGRAPGPPWLWAAGLGLGVGLAGTAGDLLASILKRRAGVKDSGEVLPGHGGLLDRLDSLALTAPTFFWSGLMLWG